MMIVLSLKILSTFPVLLSNRFLLVLAVMARPFVKKSKNIVIYSLPLTGKTNAANRKSVRNDVSVLIASVVSASSVGMTTVTSYAMNSLLNPPVKG